MMSEARRKGALDMPSDAARLLSPDALTNLVDVTTVPRKKGVHGWWFTPGVLAVPSIAYTTAEGRELLYVGIAPRKPSAAGRESASHLKARITAHATKDASRSTLRLSLGVLLADELGLVLGIHKDRANWGPAGELELTRWMNQHARISWVVAEAPWVIEDELLAQASLALNVDGRTDAFAASLSARRKQARRAARQTV
jgi:hypothetical protein